MSNPTPVPDAIDVADRTIKMRRIFAALIHRPGLDEKACRWLIQAADRAHARNVEALGWLAAEQIRAHAFTDAASGPPVPAGEATESDFIVFEVAL